CPDAAIAQVADQQRSGELAKAGWRDRHTPGRVERAAAGHPVHDLAEVRVFVDETEAGTFLLVHPATLLRIGDEDVVTGGHHVERRVPRGEGRVVEVASRQNEPRETTIEDVNGSIVEVSGEQERAEIGVPHGKALEDGPVHMCDDEGVGPVDGTAPRGDVATLAVEDEV